MGAVRELHELPVTRFGITVIMELFKILFFLLLSIVGDVTALRVTGATTNINTSTGQRPARKDLRTLQGAGPQFHLYIQALQRFQATSQSSLQSWYSVAGIHGRPFRSWDGVSGPYQRGYCTHGSTLFPTWHRPFLALYEQIISGHAKDIAATYPTSNRATYQAAANDLRIPYWDWASDAQIPTSLTATSLTITTPSGSQSVTNPLRRYNFNPRVGPPDFPTSDGFANAASTTRNSQAQARLNSNAAALTDNIYTLLTRQPNYGPFASNAFVQDRDNDYGNIESIHDGVHGMIGGWMGLIGYSSFDPIFFLHHTNIDRFFSMWQALNPNSYVGSQVNEGGTFTNRPGGTENVNTPLTPFHSDSGTGLYTSTTARSTRTFGYTYPEVTDWGVDAATLANNVAQAVENLYGPNNNLKRRSLVPFPFGKRSDMSYESEYTNANLAKRQNAVPSALKDGTGAYREWFANIRVNKFAIQESFFVHIFIGDVPSDKGAWLTAPSFVGSYVVFTDKVSTGTLYTYGQIPLTRTLIEKFQAKTPGIPDLKVATMRKYLKANLKWRAQKFDDTEIPLSDLKTLRIFAVSGLKKPKPAGKTGLAAPAPAPLEAVPEITAGKAGGVAPDAAAAALANAQ